MGKTISQISGIEFSGGEMMAMISSQDLGFILNQEVWINPFAIAGGDDVTKLSNEIGIGIIQGRMIDGLGKSTFLVRFKISEALRAVLENNKSIVVLTSLAPEAKSVLIELKKSEMIRAGGKNASQKQIRPTSTN
jgi:hypothetical protein